jgi:hypothetical protein
MSEARRLGASAWAPWLAAIAGMAATCWVFWPGLMSYDSAAQYLQARGQAPLDDVHPVVMSLLWRYADQLIEGPGAMFALFVATWWSGLALWARTAELGGVRSVAIVLGVGAWPATFLMLGHLWKDVGMSAALLFAGALIWRWRRQGGFGMRFGGLLLLFVACAFRHNAVFAAAPLLLWWGWPRAGTPARPWVRSLALSLVLVSMAGTPGILARIAGAESRHAWTVVAQWDLAAMSIARDEILLPPGMLAGPPLTVEQLRSVFDPWANPRLFTVNRIKSSFFFRFTPEQLAELRQAWWDAVKADPGAYFAHRLRLARFQFLGFPASTPVELVFVAQRLVFTQPAMALPPVDSSTLFWRLMQEWRSTPLFAGLSYLVLAVVAVGLSCRRPATGVRVPIRVLAVSAWANALPLLVLAGSAEFRYLLWTALASLLAFALALAGGRREFD